MPQQRVGSSFVPRCGAMDLNPRPLILPYSTSVKDHSSFKTMANFGEKRSLSRRIYSPFRLLSRIVADQCHARSTATAREPY